MSAATVTTNDRYGFTRVTLRCPNGHRVVDAPATSATGGRLLADDFSGESCGVTSCDWVA